VSGHPDLVGLDEILVRDFDAEVRRGEEIAEGQLACRIGCTECCVGPFEITALDAERLRRGLRELEGSAPAAARAVRERASSQWRAMAARFPGTDEGALERLCTEFETVPCPVLDPETGVCVLYRHRPLSCRSYGLPLRSGDEVLPPCRLNFTGAPAAEIEAAALSPDRDDLERSILERLGLPDTIVAAALAL
jgi:Fe-S-cluster containining protein